MTILDNERDTLEIVGAWSSGFDRTDTLIGNRMFITAEEARRKAGIFRCADGICGSVCSVSLGGIAEDNGFAVGSSEPAAFVQGVEHAILANSSRLLGGQDV